MYLYLMSAILLNLMQYYAIVQSSHNQNLFTQKSQLNDLGIPNVLNLTFNHFLFEHSRLTFAWHWEKSVH